MEYQGCVTAPIALIQELVKNTRFGRENPELAGILAIALGVLPILVVLGAMGLWMKADALPAQRARQKLPPGCSLYCPEAQLAGLDLQRVELRYVDWSHADLSGANLTDAMLAFADLTGADLSGANLTGAMLAEADLTGADLSGAVLGNANFTDAHLAGADLTGAWYSAGILWPAGFVPPPTVKEMERYSDMPCYQQDEQAWSVCKTITTRTK